ncbi:NADPH-dependent F420 reductase [Nocardia sp. NBC_00416]|uniref:NADPH-dependent F420 reductase n=1 Tax=Nocardia sp. NBC_00416 TaxID=2975991 RepID=UPI002E22F79E
MVSTLGLIGSGMIGGALARLAVAAGLDVVLSNSRGPETLADLVTELGPNARAATPSEAARAGDLVVATIPLHAYEQLPVDALTGKIVIDTMNYYPQRDDRIPLLDSNELTSSSMVQGHLAGSRVVKVCNNIDFRRLQTLARPTGAADRSALPLAGDDASARSEVARLLSTLGYDTVDIGTLADSWRSEPGTPVYVQPYFPEQPPTDLGPEAAFHWFMQTPGTAVARRRIEELTSTAVRGVAGGRFPA